jgi:hypothetical protein
MCILLPLPYHGTPGDGCFCQIKWTCPIIAQNEQNHEDSQLVKLYIDSSGVFYEDEDTDFSSDLQGIFKTCPVHTSGFFFAIFSSDNTRGCYLFHSGQLKRREKTVPGIRKCLF